MSTLDSDVRCVICEVFSLADSSGDRQLRMSDPPEWDSLGHMQLVAALEQRFNVRFPSYALADLTDVPSIVRELKTLGKS